MLVQQKELTKRSLQVLFNVISNIFYNLRLAKGMVLLQLLELRMISGFRQLMCKEVKVVEILRKNDYYKNEINF